MRSLPDMARKYTAISDLQFREIEAERHDYSPNWVIPSQIM